MGKTTRNPRGSRVAARQSSRGIGGPNYALAGAAWSADDFSAWRSIPARAGKPNPFALSAPQAKVYPRPYGETVYATMSRAIQQFPLALGSER